MLVWMCYFAAVLFVVHRMMFVAPPRSVVTENTTAILGFAVPASALSGFLGVGPGFLLVPLMAHFGIDLRKAAAINSVAVVPASFLSALPHVSHLSVRTSDVLALSAASAAGAVAGAWLTSHRVAASALKVVFVITLVLTAAARVARNFI